MDDAIKALEGAESSTEAKMMLAQHHVKTLISLVSMKISDRQLETLQKFAGKPDQLAKGDSEKHTDKYDFKSENVIELLKNLKLKFEDDQLAATKAETNALNAYALSKKARDNSIDAATKSKEKKEKELAATEKALSEAQGSLKDTTADLKADSKGLADTTESCNTKASEWEQRSKTRELEMKAMDAAIKILAKATGVRTE